MNSAGADQYSVSAGKENCLPKKFQINRTLEPLKRVVFDVIYINEAYHCHPSQRTIFLTLLKCFLVGGP